MGTADQINVLIADRVDEFIRKKKLSQPMILVNLGHRPNESSGGDGCGGCGGGGCGEGGATSYVPYVNILLVNGGNPGEDFIKVESSAGVPVFFSKSIADRARKSKGPIVISLKGLVTKRLIIEGLDLSSPPAESQDKGGSCH